MFKKVLSTAAVRVFHSLMALVILMINARLLGAANVGTISLIILGITIIVAINNFVGGSALVYLTPRFSPFQLWAISYLWGIFAIALAWGINAFLTVLPSGTGFLPGPYIWHILALSLLQSYNMVNQNILLGKEKVLPYNFANFTITTVMILSLGTIYLMGLYTEAMAYVWVLYSAYGTGFLVSMASLAGHLGRGNAKPLWKTISNMLKYGAFTQMANFIQLLNYRLSYYFLEKFAGRATLGVYTAGTQLGEGVWIVSRSTGIVQYSRISNTKDPDYAKKLSISFIKFAAVVSFLLLSVLLLLPKDIYTRIFGPGFSQVKYVIALLSPGIMALSVSLILSNYFSGRGKHYINAIGSGIGFVATLAGCLVLIPLYGLGGAAMSAVGSYVFSTSFQLIIFLRKTHARFIDFIPGRADYVLIKTEIRKLLQRGKK